MLLLFGFAEVPNLMSERGMLEAWLRIVAAIVLVVLAPALHDIAASGEDVVIQGALLVVLFSLAPVIAAYLAVTGVTQLV